MRDPFRSIQRKKARFSVAPLGLTLLLMACGGGKEAEAPLGITARDDPEEQLAAPPIETVQAPITHLERADVDEAIDAGVARFIQGFDMVEHLDEYDRFVGWKIGKIHDRGRFDGLGIGSGDVITSINGMPLERPAHAYEVLMSLKTAQSLDVEYLRGGRVMRLSLPIIGEPTKKSADPKPAGRKAAAKGDRRPAKEESTAPSGKKPGPPTTGEKTSED